MTSEISIYTQRDFAGQCEAVLHDSHIDDFHTVYPVNDGAKNNEVPNFDLVLHFLTTQEPQLLEKQLNRNFHKRTIPQARYEIHGRTLAGIPSGKKTGFDPILFGDRLRVASVKDATQGKRGEMLLKIDPKAALTCEKEIIAALSLDVLEELIRGGRRLLVLGAGPGVTAIAAAKFGAGSVDAIENNPVMMKYANANVNHNAAVGKVNLFFGGYDAIPHNDYHVVLSEVDVDSLMGYFDSITKKITKMKYFVVSGVHQEQRRTFNAFLVERELRPALVMQKNEWCTYLLRFKRGW